MNAPPSFLCDEMLGRLCRYLRAAGYDTLFANDGHSDRTLLARCKEESRFFLTQDQLVREHKAARGVALILPHGDLDHLALLTGAHFHLDWTRRAFTRCLEDNTLLRPADEAARLGAPADALRPDEPLLYCPSCQRIYWRGSHYKRMHARLSSWQAAMSSNG